MTGWQDTANNYSNQSVGAFMLANQDPTDEIVLDQNSFLEIINFRKEVVGEDDNLVSDIIWSQTIPMTDFVINVEGRKIRFCFFDEAIENLDTIPSEKRGMVGAIQELGHNHFWLCGVKKGEYGMNVSDEHYDMDGTAYKSSISDDKLFELIRLWHGIQLMLLNPKTEEMLRQGKTSKQSKRVRKDGERKRVTYYIKRHYLDGEKIHNTLREFTRHCKAWYVVGHWRNLPSGGVTYVKGHWKGELRNLKRNIDSGRERKIV